MKSDRYTIYVGLNDGDTKTQKYETERLEKLMCEICKNYEVSYSMSRIIGGYFHDNGQYVNENTVQIVLIGSRKKIADEIAKDICAFLNQKSVLIVHDKIKGYLVRESLK